MGNAGSNLSTSTGDEAGTAGGGLLSSKTKGKLTWASKSANVKVEGKGVVRFMDVAQHNGNSFNTAFMEMGGTGMAYGDDFEGPCELCGKSSEKHQIKEMRESSAKIAAEIVDRLHADPAHFAKTQFNKSDPANPKLKGYMVGVLVCNCQNWATNSGATHDFFGEAASGCTIVEGGGVSAANLGGDWEAVDGIQARMTHIVEVRASRDKATSALRAQMSKPGECAAQKLLAKAKGHELLSMTEVFWSPRDTGAWRQRYPVRTSSRAGMNEQIMSFRALSPTAAAKGATNQSVASCRSCQLMLPFVLCDLGEWKC